MKHSSPVTSSIFQLSVLSFWSWRQTWVALLEEGMTDVIDLLDDDKKERRSLADDAAVVSEVSVGTTAAADTAKFLSFCFDTRK